MFGWFKKTTEPATVPVQGQPVIMNGDGLTLDMKIARAEQRIYNLSRKLGKLQDLERRGVSERLAAVKAQTEYAIKEWEKKRALFEFEKALNEGDPE